MICQKIGGGGSNAPPPQTLSSDSPEARARMDKERDNLVCLSWWKSFKKICSNLPAGKQEAYTDFRVSKQTQVDH